VILIYIYYNAFEDVIIKCARNYVVLAVNDTNKVKWHRCTVLGNPEIKLLVTRITFKLVYNGLGHNNVENWSLIIYVYKLIFSIMSTWLGVFAVINILSSLIIVYPNFSVYLVGIGHFFKQPY